MKLNEVILKSVLTVLLVVGLIVSLKVISPILSSPKHYSKQMEMLDKERDNVMKLTAASTIASGVISAIPGDSGTPIATQLISFSKYFLVVLCAIFLEKYLMTILAYVSFTWLLPISAVILILFVWFKQKFLSKLAVKLLVFGLMMAFVIPASVKVCDMIQSTYQEEINSTIDKANSASKDVSKINKEKKTVEPDKQESIFGKVKDTVTSTASKISGAYKTQMNKLKDVVNRYVEALAVMIVTSVIVPILVVIIFIWMAKLILGVDISISKTPMVNKFISPVVGKKSHLPEVAEATNEAIDSQD